MEKTELNIEQAKEILNAQVKNIDKSDLLLKQEKEIIDKWKGSKVIKIDIPEFNIAKELVKVSISGNSTATLLVGEGGIGKSYLTIEVVKEMLKPDEWEYKSGFSTALSLYKYIYNNRHKKIIILDDVELFNDVKIIHILKSALWEVNGKRLVYYDSTSSKAKDVPNVFELQARLIMLCNNIPNEDNNEIRALISRIIKYEVNFTYEQKKAIISHIIRCRGDLDLGDRELVLSLIEKYTSEATKNFNFRVLEKLIAYVKYNKDKAEELFKATLERDEIMEAYLEAQKVQGKAEDKIAKFIELTGLSKRTYYRIAKRTNRKI